MKKYNKVLDISFTVLTDQEEGATVHEIVYGLVRRLVTVQESELQEACGEVDCSDCEKDDFKRHNLILEEANEKRQGLIDEALETVKIDAEEVEFTALEELFKLIPTRILAAYLPEEQMQKYIK